MRIGTWNLNCKWGAEHRDLLLKQDCQVWLLTEVKPGVGLAGYHQHLTGAVMGRGQHWAAVLSKQPLTGLGDPHPASAAAVVSGITYSSTILPWRGCGGGLPWVGQNHGQWTGAAIAALLAKLPKADLVWGGDWNHDLLGPVHAGSAQGRKHLLAALGALGLQVPTAGMPHRISGLYAIDHVAVPTAWYVVGAWRIAAACNGTRLSDHDAYVVEVTLPTE